MPPTFGCRPPDSSEVPRLVRPEELCSRARRPEQLALFQYNYISLPKESIVTAMFAMLACNWPVLIIISIFL